MILKGEKIEDKRQFNKRFMNSESSGIGIITMGVDNFFQLEGLLLKPKPLDRGRWHGQ